jgi:hypothetical protein
MILKFVKKENEINLDSDKAELLDISFDKRTKMLNKNEMCNDVYKIDKDVYILKKDFFIKMAKKQNRASIEALLIKHDEKNIIIVGDRSYVFYNGYSINVKDYDLIVNEEDGAQIAVDES